MDTGNMMADLIVQAVILYFVFQAQFVEDMIKSESAQEYQSQSRKSHLTRLILMSGSVGSHFLLNAIVVASFFSEGETG